MNAKIKQFCNKHGLSEEQFYGREKFGDYLYLSSLTSIPEGFNPTVGGYLNLSSLTSIPEGFNPTVGGGLNLSSLTSIPEGFNPTVGGGLDLSSLTSIPEGFNPTVGGYLYLSSLTSIPEGFNPTVGGGLNLSSGLRASHTPLNNRLITWRNGQYVMADGIITEVLKKQGRVYTVRNIGSTKEYFLVTDGKSTHAHGETLAQAKADFKFKRLAEKLKNEPITPDTIITTQRYRAITGACEFGVKHWMEQNLKPAQQKDALKNGVTAGVLATMLKATNAYGYERFMDLMHTEAV